MLKHIAWTYTYMLLTCQFQETLLHRCFFKYVLQTLPYMKIIVKECKVFQKLCATILVIDPNQSLTSDFSFNQSEKNNKILHRTH